MPYTVSTVSGKQLEATGNTQLLGAVSGILKRPEFTVEQGGVTAVIYREVFKLRHIGPTKGGFWEVIE
ncbi:MAG: hypothetical protein K2L11_05805 [Muribaculaceae bacterium]|nr:hypothetical protein [Muribaculaceae bacterium]